MSEAAALHGLGCPRCGGMVPVPEGRLIVACPFCDLRSSVAGEYGVRRYQVPCRVDQEAALSAYRSFLSSKIAIARDCARTAQLDEVLLVHLPFWTVWGRGLGWAFGEKADRQRRQQEVRAARSAGGAGAGLEQRSL
jgi:hypothetical protein